MDLVYSCLESNAILGVFIAFVVEPSLVVNGHTMEFTSNLDSFHAAVDRSLDLGGECFG